MPEQTVRIVIAVALQDAGEVTRALELARGIRLQYVLDYPDALSHLVIADAPAGIPAAFQPQQQQELYLTNTVSVSETAHRRMGKEFAARNQHLRQWLIAMVEQMDTESYRSQANATFAFNVWDRLHEITVPTTLIWGHSTPSSPCQWAWRCSKLSLVPRCGLSRDVGIL